MKHKFTVLIEIEYDDENGDYPPPSLAHIERGFQSAIANSNYFREYGFMSRPNVEAAKGDAKQAFGIS